MISIVCCVVRALPAGTAMKRQSPLCRPAIGAPCWWPAACGASLAWSRSSIAWPAAGGTGPPTAADRAFTDRVFALVANRLEVPGSEHGLAGWLETGFVCDRRGRRYVPQWRDDAERRASRSPRVRVAFAQLQRWYRTLDRLVALKPDIERALFLHLRDLFSLKVDLVLYDLTSTYFEGRGPAGRGAHGYSRDGKPRHRQVLVGLVMVDGWPIAHHLFAGNCRDSATVPEVLKDLEARFGLSRLVFIGDRGMISKANLALLRAHKQGYILGLGRRRSKTAAAAIAAAEGPWQLCPCGIAAGEAAQPQKTEVQEVVRGPGKPRVCVVRSQERQAFEQGQRQKSMDRVRADLLALQKRVADGRLTAPEKIGAAAGRILAKNHGKRYFDWDLAEGAFGFFEHPTAYPREIKGEGKYVLQSEAIDRPAVDIVQLYKSLTDVERAFSSLKDVLDMRPIYHQTDPRVEAHIFIAALAFLLHRALEKKLKAAGMDISADHALRALKTIRTVDIKIDRQKTKRCVTQGSPIWPPASSRPSVSLTETRPPRQSKANSSCSDNHDIRSNNINGLSSKMLNMG